MSSQNSNKKNNTPTPLASGQTSSTNVQEPTFSSGELGQLQEILFGQQQRTTHQQISSVQEQLDKQLQSLSNMLNSRVTQLSETFDSCTKKLEASVQQLREDHQAAISELDKKVVESNAALKSELNALSQSSGEDTSRLLSEIEQRESSLKNEIANTKISITSEMNQSVDGLQSAKIDRHDFANLLNDLSKRISSPAAPIAE